MGVKGGVRARGLQGTVSRSPGNARVTRPLASRGCPVQEGWDERDEAWKPLGPAEVRGSPVIALGSSVMDYASGPFQHSLRQALEWDAKTARDGDQ